MFCIILSGFPLISCLFCFVSDGKSCFSVRKSILTSKRHAEHLFAGRNTQQQWSFLLFISHQIQFTCLQGFLYPVHNQSQEHVNSLIFQHTHNYGIINKEFFLKSSSLLYLGLKSKKRRSYDWSQTLSNKNWEHTWARKRSCCSLYPNFLLNDLCKQNLLQLRK